MAPSRKKLYLFHGADEFHVAEAAKALVESLVPPADRDFCLEVIDGGVDSNEDVARVVRDTAGAVKTPAFLGAGKTVWLRGVSFIAPARRGGDKGDDAEGGGGRKAAVEQLRALLREIPDGHVLVLSGASIDARYGGIVADAQKMQKAGEAEVVKFEPPSKWKAAAAAANMLAAESKRRGLPLPADICRAIVARAGTDPRQLMSELEKLLLYADGAAPTAADVASVVSPTAATEPWDLLDAFGDRRLDLALPALHRLLDAGESEIMLVIFLQYRVNALLLVQDSLARGAAEDAGGAFRWRDDEAVDAEAADLPKRLATDVGGWQSRKLVAQAANYSRMELRRARHVLDNAHERMTSVAMPGELVLELALAEAMRR